MVERSSDESSSDAAVRSEDVPADAERAEAVGSDATVEEPDTDELRDELERLRVENEELRMQAVEAAPASEPSHTGRWTIVVVLVILGSLLALSAIGSFWVNRFVMDTDTFVSTIAPLAEDPAIQREVSTAVSDAVLERVDVETQVSDLLVALQDVIQPALEERGLAGASIPAQALVAPLTGAIESTVREQASNLVASPQFAQLFEQSLRAAHEGFLRAVEGAGQAEASGLVVFEDEIVYVDVNTFARVVQERLVGAGLTFLEGLTLERAQGRVVLTESSVIPTVLAAIGVLNTLAWLLPLLTLALLAGAVLLAPERRTGLILVGSGLVVVTALALLGVNVGRVGVASLAGSEVASAAVVAAYDILPADFVTLLRLVLALGILLVAGAIIMGPASWAVSLRTWFSDVVSGTGSGAAVAEFTHTWRTPLVGAGVLVGILIAVFWPGITATGVFWVAVGVLLWIVVVETLSRGRSRADEPPPAAT